MITVPELAADALGKFLTNYMKRRFGSSETHLVEMVPSIARIVLECIGNSDALYHNVEHTMLVTLLARHPVGTRVNLEADLIAKHVDRLVSHFMRSRGATP